MLEWAVWVKVICLILIQYQPVYLCAYVSSVSRGQTAESQSSPSLSLCSVSQGRPLWKAQRHTALETSAAFCQALWSQIQQPWHPRHAEQIFTSDSLLYTRTLLLLEFWLENVQRCRTSDALMNSTATSGRNKALCWVRSARLSAGDAECCKLQRWDASARWV